RLRARREAMPVKIDWDATADDTFSVNGIPVWKKVADFVADKAVLQITADGQFAVAGKNCDVDGNLALPASLRANADYPTAALIGKIGGRTTGQEEGTQFALGKSCIVVAPTGGGPWFGAIHADPSLLA